MRHNKMGKKRNKSKKKHTRIFGCGESKCLMMLKKKESMQLDKKKISLATKEMCVYKMKYKWSSGRPWQINLEMKDRCSVRPPGEATAIILESAGC
jgi:hypothetical protein